MDNQKIHIVPDSDKWEMIEKMFGCKLSYFQIVSIMKGWNCFYNNPESFKGGGLIAIIKWTLGIL